MELIEKALKKEIIYQGRRFAFCSDEVLLPNGETSRRDYIAHPGAVAVAALDENNELYFVRQFRYPPAQPVLEIPAGKLEWGEDHYSCAVRELSEEERLQEIARIIGGASITEQTLAAAKELRAGAKIDKK